MLCRDPRIAACEIHLARLFHDGGRRSNKGSKSSKKKQCERKQKAKNRDDWMRAYLLYRVVETALVSARQVREKAVEKTRARMTLPRMFRIG